MALNSNQITIWKDKNNTKTIGVGNVKNDKGEYTNFSLSEVYNKDGLLYVDVPHIRYIDVNNNNALVELECYSEKDAVKKRNRYLSLGFCAWIVHVPIPYDDYVPF